MKILYVTTISATINAFLIPHIKLLIEQGNYVDVACNDVNMLEPELNQFGVNQFNIPFQRDPLKKENYSAYKKIKEIVLRNGYDLIHVHTPTASFITRLACRSIRDLKVVYTAHGFHFYKGAPIKNWLLYYTLERIAAKWTDGIITMNLEDYKSACKLKMRRKNSVFYIHGVGIDLNRFAEPNTEDRSVLRINYRYDSNQFILFFAAELNRNKHQDILIKAVKELREKGIEVLLLLAGEGSMAEQYKKLTLDLGLEQNVKFLGYRRDILNLLKIADIAVSSSRREGLPVNVLEAMASGLPVIAANSRGNRDLIINNENGLVVEDDPKLYAYAIERLIKSDELRDKFGEKNRTLIQSYALENVLRELLHIYFVFMQS